MTKVGALLQAQADSVAASEGPGAEPGMLETLMADLTPGEGWFWKLLLSVAVVIALWLLRRLTLRFAYRRIDAPRARYQWAKTTGYVAALIGIVGIGAIWFEGIKSLGTVLGLMTAGLAIALKDVVTDAAGWIFIHYEKPFELGDRIQIDNLKGDVVDIRVFEFSILEIGNWVHADQSTGRVIHVPNSYVFSKAIANYSAEFEYLWHEIPVLLTFESDWRKARRILDAILQEKALPLCREAEASVRRASRKFLIFYSKLTPTIYLSVQDSGVLLTLRYLCKPRQRRGTSQQIWEAILDAFDEEEGIDFAYPTHRSYVNILEGKEGARAPAPELLRSRVWADEGLTAGSGDPSNPL